MNLLKIGVKYSCPDCGLVDVDVRVPARMHEDLLVWMDATTLLLAQDHHHRSPDCRPLTLRNLKIPMTGTDRVGGPVLN